MDQVIGNWIKENISTLGTSETITLTAISGFTRVQDVPRIVVGRTVRYVIEDGTSRETGLGTRQAGSTFDRTTPEATLIGSTYDDSSPARINLSGTAILYLSANATDWDVTALASTGLREGGAISINTDSTKIDIAAGEGMIVDNYTDTNNPTVIHVSWSAFTALTVDNLLTTPRSFIAIDNTGSVVQQATDFTNIQAKDLITLGSLGHANLTNVVAVVNTPIAYLDGDGRLSDLMKALGPFNISGNIFSPNGANLNIDKSAGKSLRLGSNFHNNSRDVDATTDPSATADTFIYAFRDGAGGWNLGSTVNAIVPSMYDDNSGTLAAVTTNKWSIQVLKYFGVIDAPKSRIEYGQTVYNSKQAALDALPDATAIGNPAFFDGVVRAFLVLRGGGTDLSDLADAVFVEGAKFGAGGGGQFTSATTNLQQAYENSTSPEIETNAANGALTVKEGSTVGGNLFEGRDDANALLFSVSVAGDLTANNVPLNATNQTVDPTVNEDSGDGYSVGSRWWNTTLDKEFVLLDATVGAAVWKETSAAAGGSPFTDLEFSLNLSRTTATLNGAATDGMVNLGSGTSITGTAGQSYAQSTIGGGNDNQSTGILTTIAGGSNNRATGLIVATVCGGQQNEATANYSAVCGGLKVKATGSSSTATGGFQNTASGAQSTISGGQNNTATAANSTVSGGQSNSATGADSTVLGGRGNKTSHTHSLACGGGSDTRANFDLVLGATDTATPAVANNTIRLQGTGGNIKIDGAVTSPEADYAEMFEWADDNPDGEDRVGTFVSLVNGKIVADGSNIIGIISGAPSMVGNGAPNNWAKMYVKDKYKRQIKVSYDVISWTDEQDNEHSVFEDVNGIRYDEYPQPTNVKGTRSQKVPSNKSTRRKIKTPMINPKFDITKEYIPRADRKEWDAVGLLGQIVVNTEEKITGTHIRVQRGGDVINGNQYQVIEVIDDQTVVVFYK